MWILTNGVNIGIAKEIGSRVNDELVQRQIMRCHRHPHTDFEKMPPLCLLGIVREDLLTCADKFEANKESNKHMKNPSDEASSLKRMADRRVNDPRHHETSTPYLKT
ncbi:hypothetical protein HPB51_008401 [Rhipicephalus microplus]|uniref:Uncharacterized protein n=1 Tax=Rhipicephalus microplus TaxID=6941 RepID=A0A9J6DU51_RHIMP|nr:hypothetical protein HPB51_008401 [Rhipicephalus microplus]